MLGLGILVLPPFPARFYFHFPLMLYCCAFQPLGAQCLACCFLPVWQIFFTHPSSFFQNKTIVTKQSSSLTSSSRQCPGCVPHHRNAQKKTSTFRSCWHIFRFLSVFPLHGSESLCLSSTRKREPFKGRELFDQLYILGIWQQQCSLECRRESRSG